MPDEIEHDENDLGDEADPQGFHLDDIKEERRNRLRHMAEMKKNRTPCFATVKGRCLLTLSLQFESTLAGPRSARRQIHYGYII